MEVKFAKLHQFRNYKELELYFNSRVNLFVGLNGQGKTNLIESLEIALAGVSFRLGQNTDLIHHESLGQQASSTIQVKKTEGEKTAEVIIKANKKENFINGRRVSLGTLKKTFSTVVFSPDSLAVVKSGPHQRRQLLDSLLISIDKESGSALFEYEKCIKAKNRVLKDHLADKIGTHEVKILIESLNESLLPLATNLVIGRLNLLKSVIPRVRKVLSALLNSDFVDISVDYVISDKSAIAWSRNQVYDTLQTRLVELSAAEFSSGQSLVGPHKHDVRFNFNGRDARYFCSQGQQRAIALAFKVAQIFEYQEIHGEYPVLLLDDVFSELDAEKSKSLLRILHDLPAQIFLTTAELETKNLFSLKEATVFEIEKGNVKTGWI